MLYRYTHMAAVGVEG